MTIKLLTVCAIFCVLILSPVRVHFTGDYDYDPKYPKYLDNFKENPDPDPSPTPLQHNSILSIVYLIFTYMISGLTAFFLLDQTKRVVAVRQAYLGQQNSVTDRTIRISGITPELRNVENLRKHIENLEIGKVSKITICRDWTKLKELFAERKQVQTQLEYYYSKYFGVKVEKLSGAGHFRIISAKTQVNSEDLFSYMIADEENQHQKVTQKKRPTLRLGYGGMFGNKVDAINHLTSRLQNLDVMIEEARQAEFEPTNVAFVTMDSVASAQMASQAVLDPHAHQLIAKLAPAPHDVLWDNILLTPKEKFIKRYAVTLVITITTVALVFPVSTIATLLNVRTISKFWPALGEMIKNSQWATMVVTGLLPPLLFTLLSVALPYLYVYLARFQGYISNGEQELSVVGKNFFYIFFNLFLVFTFTGTAGNYWSYLSDTTKIAQQLATSLQQMSLFYVDLILLQGIGLFPFRLLQLGDIFLLFWNKITGCCTSPRQYRYIFTTTKVFDFGLILPQPILILVITIVYSVLSTKIVLSSLLFFILGFYTYKYQLVYSMVHPQHSTGQVWPLILRRVCMGLLFFQLFMAGTLALENSYSCAVMMIPLPFLTATFIWSFEKDYSPLLFFIALRAIKNSHDRDYSSPHNENVIDDETPLLGNRLSIGGNNIINSVNPVEIVRRLRTRRSTIDEDREVNLSYDYPYLNELLDGPWVGYEPTDVCKISIVSLHDSEIYSRKLHLNEWN